MIGTGQIAIGVIDIFIHPSEKIKNDIDPVSNEEDIGERVNSGNLLLSSGIPIEKIIRAVLLKDKRIEMNTKIGKQIIYRILNEVDTSNVQIVSVIRILKL